MHESGWIPDLLGRVTYEIPTGPYNSNQVHYPAATISPSRRLERNGKIPLFSW
jgi:hypothetical protein